MIVIVMNCCPGVNDIKADHTASHLGKAQGLVTVLRGLPFNANRRIVYLPQDVMIKVGWKFELLLVVGHCNLDLSLSWIESIFDLNKLAIYLFCCCFWRLS